MTFSIMMSCTWLFLPKILKEITFLPFFPKTKVYSLEKNDCIKAKLPAGFPHKAPSTPSSTTTPTPQYGPYHSKITHQMAF